MKKAHYIGFICLIGLTLLNAGCETESADNPVVINPSATTIRDGQSVRFTATGGYDYTWSLGTADLGYLSSQTGDSVVYTSTYDPGSNGAHSVQVLTVTSTIEGSGGNTNNAGYSVTATANITHL